MPVGSEPSTEGVEQPIRVGDWCVDPFTGRITGGEQGAKLEQAGNFFKAQYLR